MTEYDDVVSSKGQRIAAKGVEFKQGDVHDILFPFERDIVLWACKKGRAAIFLDTGLGKTFIQLEWARLIGKRTLIIAPLSVARQTVNEAKKIDLDVHYVRKHDDVSGDGIWITNYELIGAFDFPYFDAIVLDESSILKGVAGKTKAKILDKCKGIPNRLACTATPAPNDYVEFGNHAEFLGICSRSEMLATFFINANREHVVQRGKFTIRTKGRNDGGQEWRLKHHGHKEFFRWLASWAVYLDRPDSLGYDGSAYKLPKLHIHQVWVDHDIKPADGMLFPTIGGIQGRHTMRKQTIGAKLSALSEIISNDGEQWIVWTGLNEESRVVSKSLPDCVEVYGSQSPEEKTRLLEEFQDGKHRILVSKSKLCGFGMNFQNASRAVFFGLNDSWEQYYQSIRRIWRFGQTKECHVYIIMAEAERDVLNNVLRKDKLNQYLRGIMMDEIKSLEVVELGGESEDFEVEDGSKVVRGGSWTAVNGDSFHHLKTMDDDSIHLSVYSPPFIDLYVYSDSRYDLGNSTPSEFFKQYALITKEIFRVTRPGRLSCVHCSDLPALQQKDGYIGIKDFPGQLIKMHEEAGWIFHGRAFVQKNPQAQAIRTHSKALLFVQLRRDSTSSRPALVDQILIFAKPGSGEPVKPVDNGELDNETWISWAHGIWTDISESDTLRKAPGRDVEDEKHICPLQLGTIERCIKLYSNPGETVLTPFMGIGSEAYQAVRFGRRAIGIELKESYHKTAVENLRAIESENSIPGLFDNVGGAR